MTGTDLRRLTRECDGRPARPVRIAHLGPGNFFRAHQAWYTEHASDGADWGIAAFAGRSGAVARDLAVQDGLYTLLVRAADGDSAEVVSALTTVSADLDDWRRCFARPGLALVPLTVTEAGYRRADDGGLNWADPDVAADVKALREHGTDAEVVTASGKLALGLVVRHARGLPGPTVVPCDNVPDNGPMVARLVGELTEAADPHLAGWIAQQVAFVTTTVDRITPHATDDDRAQLRALAGVDDPVAVVTEPYAEWVLCGEFPQGRPRWEDVGARFVADIVPWENRKLWLLNGSHSLMAYAGTLRGYHTVYEAVSDPVVRGWVEQWWDDASRHLPLPGAEIAAYRSALLQRSANPRAESIEHLEFGHAWSDDRGGRMNKEAGMLFGDDQAAVDQLTAQLAEVGRLGVAFSGGVDSATLLALAIRALGPARVLAIIGVSPSLADDERAAAHDVARFLGASAVEVVTHEGERSAYRANGPRRCFHCKDELFTRISGEVSQQHGLDAIAYGENADDVARPDRPGSQAATKHRVLRPLADAGLDKAAVRRIARAMALPCADKPAAPCLASRIPHHEPVTAEKLAQIESAERALRGLGFEDCRVRHHGDVARVELPLDAIPRAAGRLRSQVHQAVMSAGFRFVAVDLAGIQSGAFTLPLVAVHGG